MRYEVRLGERTVRLELAPDGTALADDVVVALRTHRLGPDAWSVSVGPATHEVHVLGRDPLRLWVDGVEVQATVADERALAATVAGGGARPERHELRAPMPGLLKAVHVREGDTVERGAPLVTLEAMKMENELRAPLAGRVTRVAQAPGAKVDGGALLVVLARE
ncbi:MAG TPA: biotin/lipoyl-containing protein [Candidatus Limnocylindria bacterium]|nr:biotin/lipoyl-containing protein [Candidatus Limnocylindria bacterium]